MRHLLLMIVLLQYVLEGNAQILPDNNLFKFDSSSTTRWSSPENINSKKGEGGRENFGAKGSASMVIDAGDSLDLLNIQGQGIINRIWITIDNRSPENLRSLTVKMYWDNDMKPAVSVPLSDFFGIGLGRMTAFQNALFASPEGRSFNSFIPMPFKKAARITVVNEAKKRLNAVYFDVNYQLLSKWSNDYLYFHAFWHRDTATVLAKDFELLPHVTGKGRFLGTHVGINANPAYNKIWWGEGEVKIYMDGDKEYPTLVGTGTEDYIGDAWSQNAFVNNYTGCLVSDPEKLQWTFYRYHLPDPVYFKKDCRITIHQMGSSFTKEVMEAEAKGAEIIPVVYADGKGDNRNVYKKNIPMNDPSAIDGFTLFYRSDDMSATSYFYLDKTSSNLPALQSLEIRTYNLKAK